MNFLLAAVRCLQITDWQKHRGYHTRWASVRLNSALIVSLIWQSLFLSHNQSQCSLHLHCCYHLFGITSNRKHFKYVKSFIFILLTLKGAICKIMVILTSWHHCTVLLMFFNNSVLSHLLFPCIDVVLRWVFLLSPGGVCELSMNPGRILSSRHPPSQSHNLPVRLISPLTHIETKNLLLILIIQGSHSRNHCKQYV